MTNGRRRVGHPRRRPRGAGSRALVRPSPSLCFTESVTEPFPQGCPPDDATPMPGIYYRLTNRRHEVGDLTAADSWLRPYETRGNPFYRQPELCEAHGLSLFADIVDLSEARDIVPLMRRKPVASVQIHHDDGVLRHTPLDGHGESHHDWWTSPFDLLPQAEVIMPKEDA